MSIRLSENIDMGIKDSLNSEEAANDASPSTKLERRRRIEDLFEEKRLREEFSDFDMI